MSIPEGANLQFSGHETFPLRHGWLTKVATEVCSHPDSNRGLFSDADAIVRFGVGNNMVKSIRHWARVAKVIDTNDGEWALTNIGQYLFGEDGQDRYAESFSTTWLVHWFLCSNYEKTTTWYWVFNNITEDFFDRDEITQEIFNYCIDRNISRASKATIKRDVDCLMRCYVTRGEKGLEDDLESVLGDLNLIQPAFGNSRFRFRKGDKTSLHDAVFNFALFDYMKRQGEANTISVEDIVYKAGSPGRVFKLDEQSAVRRLVNIEDTSNGVFSWSETAGLRQVALINPPSDPIQLLSPAYGQ